MTVHIDLSIWELLFWIALLFLAAIGVTVLAAASILPACDKWLTARVLGRAERIAEYEAAIASPHQLQPTAADPEVHVGQVVEAAEPNLPLELRPTTPVAPAEVPIWASVPYTLPLGMDFGFNWAQPLTASTGTFPVIEQYSGEDPEPTARERFATPPPKTRKRKPSVTVTVGDEVRTEDLAEAATQ